MEQLHFITKLLDIKDPNVQILNIINKDTHKEIIAKLKKRIFIALNIKKERTKFVLSRA
ncbi:hypothetical protein [Streptococcus pneumoniae]|uniref:hypothetical protein n=1 Tax=Streptococcus pneumoniae TaxID=1313 RepID=UPI001024915A|nr:hypothetical protein [Streptococcus pneumoniae]VFH85799.1 transposase [Streptococcus pneumoniae]